MLAKAKLDVADWTTSRSIRNLRQRRLKAIKQLMKAICRRAGQRALVVLEATGAL